MSDYLDGSISPLPSRGTANRALALLIALTTAGCCKSDEIPALSSQLYSNRAAERNDAALELARCGAKAERAVPRLSQLLYDENVGVQSAAAYALRKIDTPSARAIMARVDASRRK